jgi:hypothetical protein
VSTFTVKLDVRDRGDRLSAICADVPGLHIYGHSLTDVRARAMKAVKYLLERNRGMKVADVSPTDDMTVLRVRTL